MIWMPKRGTPEHLPWVEDRLVHERKYLAHVESRKSKYPGVRKMHKLQATSTKKAIKFLESELKRASLRAKPRR